MRDESTDTHPTRDGIDPAEGIDAIDGDDGVGQGSLALACADDKVASAGDRASACCDCGKGLVERGSDGEVHE